MAVVLIADLDCKIQVIALHAIVIRGIAFNFGIMPVLVALTPLIPESVEATLAALIYGILTFSYDWGGKLVTSQVFKLIGIEKGD